MSHRFVRVAFVIAAATVPAFAFACSKDRSANVTAKEEPAFSVPAAAPIADQAQLTRRATGGGRELSGVAVSGAGGFGSGRQTSTPPQAQQPFPGSMLIRNGQASVQVDSLEIGLERVRQIARRTNAIIANTSMRGGREQVRSASLELRIPSDRFDEAVSGLAPIGKLESVSVSVQDVGEEYVDIEARMTNARRLEQRLVELLANRTGKLADVLSVEHELARVREEIERYEGRLRYLRSRVSVSSLTVAVHEPYPIVADRPGAHPIRDAFVQAWRNLVNVTAAIIASLGVIVPIGLIAVLLILLGRRILPARSPRLAPEKPTSSESA